MNSQFFVLQPEILEVPSADSSMGFYNKKINIYI